MTNPPSDILEALARRCEEADGSDCDLDRAIMEALSLAPDYGADWGPRDHYKPAPFEYTASLDAAMSLVPEGWFWCAMNAGGAEEPRPIPGLATALVFPFDDIDARNPATASTPALALCAASLRALAAKDKGNE